MKRIAIVGQMHTGKTTLANELVEHHGFVRLALADPLKEAACDMLSEFINRHYRYFPDRWDALGKEGRPPIPIDRQELEDAKSVFRPFLQWLGSEFAREYLKNNNCWLDMLHSTLSQRYWEADVVCDDVRFPNEAEYLRRLGFQIVRVHRNEEERLVSLRRVGPHTPEHLGHQSESRVCEITPDREFYHYNLDGFRHTAQRLANA